MYLYKKSVKILFVLLTFTIVWLMLFQFAYSQENTSTFELDLATLGYSTEQLNGPTDNVRYLFSLPPTWNPQEGTYLELNLTYMVTGQADTLPGILQVRLNEDVLFVENFTTTEMKSINIEIPPDSLRLTENPNANSLQLSLSVPTQCDGEDKSASLTVDSSSLLHFVYSQRPLQLDLALYPKPLYYPLAIETIPAHLVFPAQPNATELSTAAIVAAGLGNLTDNELPLGVSLGSTLPITISEQNIMIIGSAERIPLLQEIDLPISLRERRLELRSQIPAAVTSSDPFSITLYVENTNATAESVILEDQLSPWVDVESCQQCQEDSPGLLRWELESLAPGQIVSTTVNVRLADELAVGDIIEHTASLFDTSGQVINVNTLTTTVSLQTNNTIISSSLTGGIYFFALDNQAIPETDGIVQLVESPWNTQRVAVIVTGLSDTAVLRAAQALAAQTRIPGMQGQFAIVQATRPITTERILRTQHFTLAELDYNDLQIGPEGRAQYLFRVPRGGILAEEAYLALHLAHGVALHSISSTLEIRLNGVAFHSVELGKENIADYWTKVPLPAQRLGPGLNRLDFYLAGNWPVCMNSSTRERFWTTIYADSLLHVPYDYKADRPVFDLRDYPQLLSGQPGLQDVILISPPQTTPNEVKGLVQLFSFLGDAAQGEIFAPQVTLADQTNPHQWNNYHLILLGRPTVNPYITFVNDWLPQPFIDGRDEIKQQVDDVVYRLPSGYDLGIIQLLPVPWQRSRAMLLITGTTDEGVRWAIDTASGNESTWQLSGNLAVLTAEEQVHATDTRKPTPQSQADLPTAITTLLTPELTPTITPLATTATMTPVEVISTATANPNIFVTSATDDVAIQDSKPFWLIPLLILSIIVVVVAVGIAVWQARS